MGGFDAHQFGQAIEIRNVTGCQEAAGDKVIKGSTDVDHHLAGRLFLQAITRQLGHQHIHRVFGCEDQEGGLVSYWTGFKEYIDLSAISLHLFT